MLTQPGSGYFGSGLQQVIDRPFGLSEWIHVYPNVYAAEGPAILAAYGMGLQGWDASYEFQSQADRQVFDDIAGDFPWGVWEADVPTSLGQFPALARMIYRGDVKEGEVISVRRVSPADLAEGKFSFSDKVEQHGDVKTFGGSVPPEALAAGRVVVEFTDKSQPSQMPDMKPLPPGLGHRVGDGAAGLGHFRPGVFHGEHRRHEGGRRLHRRQGADAGRREDQARHAVRVAVPDGAGAWRGPRQRQAGPDYRAGPRRATPASPTSRRTTGC